ncbi:hypothetical protein AB4Y32_39965 [Paraburkholderia phymatum]|uniref:Uncharacterized protein n=1 Tax=Paraburkholderia phymatum TaxID=148447 RepID=A0ACC6UEG9_9BURK
MRIFGWRRATSTSTVFATGTESQWDKQILAARAKRHKRVAAFLQSATEQAKEDFVRTVGDLNRSLVHHATVSERLLVFIDNNVLQDVLKHEEEPRRRARFHALLALLMVAEDHYLLDIFACVSPAIVYEAGYRGVRPADVAYSQVMEALADIGLRTHSVGFNRPAELRKIFRRIRHDERQIRRALDEIRATSWKRDFTDKDLLGIRIPFAVAEDECPNVRLRHFDPNYVKFLLMHIIEKQMFRENGDQKKARRLMEDPKEKAFSVIKPHGDGVEGLGDVELISCCDLSAQTVNRTPYITMALTVDGGLQNALKRLGSVRSRATLDAGTDDVEDGVLRMMYAMRDHSRRTAKANRRVAEYGTAYEEFLNTIRCHFTRDAT